MKNYTEFNVMITSFIENKKNMNDLKTIKSQAVVSKNLCSDLLPVPA